MKKSKSSTLIVAAVLLLSGSTFAAFADNNSQDSNKSRPTEDSSTQNKVANGEGPEVRFGKPSRIISSDDDQRDYDQKDGVISGVATLGSRIFEARVINAASPATVVKSPNLVKHSGSAMPVTHLYAIYWGSSFPNGYQADVNGFLGSIGAGTNPLNALMSQYMTNKKVANSTTFTTTSYSQSVFTDTTSNPPTAAPTTSSILAEVYKVVVTNAKQKIDPAGMYLVFTNNYPASANYCAWHGAGSVNKGSTFTVAYQPFLGGTAGCAASYMANYTQGSSISGVDSVANVASHEIYETITDPLLNAWYDSAGAEIADKCSWYFGSTKIGVYSVQPEWSNAVTGCAKS
ncbi:hypothetical protein MCERE155_01021 [Candidatus Nanopelagicaceae bacterium]